MDIPLGRPTRYTDVYDPGLLAPIPRAEVRAALGMGSELPFRGEDVWNGYEFSWLNARGVPRVTGLQLRVPAESPCMVESKSLKLYLNGFAQRRFATPEEVRAVLEADLARVCGAAVAVALPALDALPASGELPGQRLDDLDIDIDCYERNPALLGRDVSRGEAVVEETLHTHLFRSLCPVTSQPDWASLLIRYRGAALEHAGLLRYLVSYRRHQAFHETTIEQIFLDLQSTGGLEQLMVAGWFLRRGGLDINPVRSNYAAAWPPLRLSRQ